MWTSLQVVTLIVALLGPLSIALSAVFINRRLKRVEQEQWRNRKVVDKRIEIFDRIAPRLNEIYCYFNWIGRWQRLTPLDVIEAKREVDQLFHINRYIIDEELFAAYEAFMALCFRTFVSIGSDALIRTTLTSEYGDRRSGKFFPWQPGWEVLFDAASAPSRAEVSAAYDRIMQRFKALIGL